jgi:hypothetical protein
MAQKLSNPEHCLYPTSFFCKDYASTYRLPVDIIITTMPDPEWTSEPCRVPSGYTWTGAADLDIDGCTPILEHITQ